MNFFIRAFLACHIFMLVAVGNNAAYGAAPLLIAYGGHNETMAPIWKEKDFTPKRTKSTKADKDASKKY